MRRMKRDIIKDITRKKEDRCRMARPSLRYPGKADIVGNIFRLI